MKKWKPVLGVVLIFITGVMFGIAGSLYYVKQQPPFKRLSHKERTDFIIKRLNDKLDLNPEQREQIEVIVLKTHEESKKLFLRHREQMDRLMDESNVDMKKVLNPDQQKKLDELRKEFERRKPKDAPPPPPMD